MAVTGGEGKLTNRDMGPTVVAMDIYDTSSQQNHQIGTRLVKGDRVYFYSRAGAGDIKAGFICTGSSYGIAVSTKTAHGAGTTIVSISSNYGAAGKFDGGYLFLQNTGGTAPNRCETYRIRSTTSSVGGNFTVTLKEGLAFGSAVGTSGIVANSVYDSVITAPVAMTQPPACVPAISTSAGYYFWGQTWGPCSLVSGTNLAATSALREIVVGPRTAGTFAPNTYVTVTITGITPASQVIGNRYGPDAITTGMGHPVYLTIAR